MLDILDLQPWAIVTATVAGMLIGAAWYSPLLFGNAWLAALGKTQEELVSPVPAMIGSAFCCLLSALGMAVIVGWFGIEGATGGGLMGAFVGITLVATAMLSDSLFCGTGWKLYWIQAGYRVTYLVMMGAILAGWPA